MWKVAASFVAVLGLCGCQTTVKDVVDDYGYAEVVPPSRLYQPGTIVAVRSMDPFTVERVCAAEKNVPGKIPATSPTSTRELRKKLDTAIGLQAAWLAVLVGSVKYASVSEVEISVSNASVIEFDHATFFEARGSRQPACQAAIDAAMRNNGDVTAIVSAFIADITYTIVWERGIEAGVKTETIKDLQAELDAHSTVVGDDKIVGKALIWGIRDNANLVDIPESVVARKVVKDDSLLARRSVRTR